MEIFNDMNSEINLSEVDRSHRIGKLRLVVDHVTLLSNLRPTDAPEGTA